MVTNDCSLVYIMRFRIQISLGTIYTDGVIFDLILGELEWYLCISFDAILGGVSFTSKKTTVTIMSQTLQPLHLKPQIYSLSCNHIYLLFLANIILIMPFEWNRTLPRTLKLILVPSAYVCTKNDILMHEMSLIGQQDSKHNQE